MNPEERPFLILGGGTMQLPAIREARSLGLTVHVADGNAECYGGARADFFHHVDLRDRDGLVACAQQISGLAGVFTAGTDFSSSVAWVAEHLGLPGISYETSLDCTDKGRMRRRLAAAGVSVPRFRIVAKEEVVDMAGLQLPVVVKPVDNMGARGVQLVESYADLAPAIAAAQALSTQQAAIVEERIPGREYSLDAIVADDRVVVTGIAERHIFFPPWFVELGHTIPAELSHEARAALVDVFQRAIQALGITRGAAKGDLFLAESSDNGGPIVTVGEIAARLSGGYMSGWTYPLASGTSPTRAAILMALGEPLPETLLCPSVSRIVTERALISAPGTVAAVTVPEIEEGEFLFINCREGDVVAPPRNNVEKVANVITSATTAEDAARRAAALLSRVSVRLVPGNEETDAFLFRTGLRGRWARFTLTERIQHELTARSEFRGDVSDVRAELRATGVLPVVPLLEESLLDSEIRVSFPGEAARGLLHSLHATTSIVYRAEAPAADGIFWSAFLTAGLQGYHYLVDSLLAEEIRW